MTNDPPAADPKSNPNLTPAPAAAPATPARPRGPDWWLMMKAFLTQGRKIASFAPRSCAFARFIPRTSART